jgi:hypothetical protein
MKVAQVTETFPAAQTADSEARSRGAGCSLPQRNTTIGPACPVPDAPEVELMDRVLKGLIELPGRSTAKPLRQR